MSRHRILLQTDPPFVKTGLAENGKTLARHWFKQDKYDFAYYCAQGTATTHPHLNTTPWKSYGCIPPDQELINRINADPLFGRNASYGSVNIDAVIRDWKPTIWIGANDIWSFPLSDYADKPWYSKIHSLHHITIDSVPVNEQAYEQAKRSKNYLTWAKFGAKEMQRVGGPSMSHVSSIYGAMDINLFSPISPQEKSHLRKQFQIPEDTFIFLFVFRNQLRKSANRVLEAYSRFRKEHPSIKTALHFHTSFSEKAMGWDFPKMLAFYNIDPKELYCTYVCKECGAWAVAPYGGEDLRCPVCGAEKGLISANITTGVPAAQMKFIYGLSDACLSIFTSGGQEYHSVQSLLCGKPLACTNYSCGEDFCLPDITDSFVTPITWHPYDEAGSNFVKAANDVGSITSFMRKMVRQSKRDLQEAGEKGRAWAASEFGIEAIGKQWDKLFDTLPTNLDWSSVDLTSAPRKNPNHVPIETSDNALWLKDLYKNILLMDVPDQDSGLTHWLGKLAHGVGREPILAYFKQVAEQENAKLGGGAQNDFGSWLDNTGRKRCLVVIKESIGDVVLVTSLFEDLHRQHPNTDLYVGTDPKYHELLVGNEHIHKVLPYIPAMEQELAMIGQGSGTHYFDYYYHLAVTTQRHLSYLSAPEPSFDILSHE